MNFWDANDQQSKSTREPALYYLIRHMTHPGPGFEEYLKSKRIHSDAFRSAEPDVWNNWKREFEQVHPNSFTVQKLNLINVIRRKYLLPPAGDSKAPSNYP